jgi:hypothetical protein
MNAKPRSPTSISTAAYPREFEQVIREKSANFVGREFVFAAINDFLERENRGYFTLVGAPGSGKSAILAKYVAENPDVVYYNAQIAGKNQVDQFLTTLCNQLINDYPLGYTSLPDNVTDGSWFLSLLLQKIGDELKPNQRLTIAIDALDAIDPRSQTPGSNLFYLPRYLPNRVYFLLSRRPFLREKSGLLIETPSRIFDLDTFPKQNREDVRKYIEKNLTPPAPLPCEGRGGKDDDDTPLLAGEGLGERSTLINDTPLLAGEGLGERSALRDLCENNFMYLKCVGEGILVGEDEAIAQLTSHQLPETLEAYYQQHWQKMKGEEPSTVELGVLQTLTALPSSENNGISAQLIAETIDQDEYEIEEVLENWYEFLAKKEIDGEVCYSIYHSSFRNWLAQQININTDIPLILINTDIPLILEETYEWVATDPDGELSAVQVKGYPHVTCQVILLRRLPPEMTWTAIAQEFGIPLSTVASFYQRECLPRLRKFAQKRGYLD